jgi:hypothetical protein
MQTQAMMDFGTGMGRNLMILGAVVFAAGLLLTYGGRLPFRLGRLPGDIAIRGKHGAFYFPLMTCLVLSVLFSLAMWLFRKR